MTQNSWKIYVKKSIDDAMLCYFKTKTAKNEGKFPSGESGETEKQFIIFFDFAEIFQRCVLDRGHQGLSKSWFIFCI